MSTCPDTYRVTVTDSQPHWGAVASLSLGVAGLVAAELFPVSLLTPMAADLNISEGLAGQAITVTAMVGLVTSLLTALVTQRWDRRHVFMFFSAAMMLSSLMVTFAGNLPVFVLGRILLGFAVGGFWSLAAATTVKLVPEALVPKALSLVFGGGSIATVVAAPLGSSLGSIIGWRNVFLLTAGLGLMTLIWQFIAFPSLRAGGQVRLGTLVDVFKRKRFRLGIVSDGLIYMGHFALFTYLRPFLESVTHVGVSGVSAILLGFGIASFLGNALAGVMVERNQSLTLTAIPVVMSLTTVGLLVFGGSPWLVAVLVACWGIAFAIVPVGWTTWIAQTVPDQVETAGGLLVAAVQLAISLGAAVGGLAFDRYGSPGAFGLSGLILLAAAQTTLMCLNTKD